MLVAGWLKKNDNDEDLLGKYNLHREDDVVELEMVNNDAVVKFGTRELRGSVCGVVWCGTGRRLMMYPKADDMI